MKYKTYALGELVQIKYGKNQKKVLSEDGTIPIYGTGGLMGYATEALYDKPSVLIGRKGTIGKVRYVDHPFWTVDTLFYTIVNTELVLPKYLFYLMSQMDLNAYNEGTTIPSLRTETLNRLEFNIPSIEEQKEVLSYLEPIDDKIQLNTEINKNLTNNEPCESVRCDASGSSLTHGGIPTDSYGDKRYEHVAKWSANIFGAAWRVMLMWLRGPGRKCPIRRT